MSTDRDVIKQRLLPVLKRSLRRILGGQANALWPEFERRFGQHFDQLHTAMYQLYGHRYDFEAQVRSLLLETAKAFATRPASLHANDLRSASETPWHQSQRAIGGTCYVDRFAGNLAGVRAAIPYFRKLGITYLHLMPLFNSPEGRSDGGYAVSDYRSVRPDLGSMADLQQLASELRAAGIRLALDFIYNHTSDQHEWARRARKGHKKYLDFYYFFPDRREPDAYEQTLREIFPEESPGSFSWCEELELWVWTSFKPYQWDLNYANPEVLRAMAGEMLYLANVGVDVLRMDAIAFAWKEKGTPCESLEQVYALVEAFNAVAQIAAPSLLFKSEAIVHPDEVARYIRPDRCQLSYNPLLMALLWESLATRNVGLLRHSLARRFAIPDQTQWVNYVRCHDDIGWTFSDEDAAEIGINAYHHRQFLNQFYTGEFEGSFARGLPFQFNEKNGDCRICGSTASLAGLEKAMKEETGAEVELALDRVLLLYSVIFSIGGVPLLYLGDELALLNDYSYREDPHLRDDSRWAQRPQFDKSLFEAAKVPGSPASRVFDGMHNLVRARQEASAFAGNRCQFLPLEHRSVLGYLRPGNDSNVLVLNNFSEKVAALPAGLAARYLGPGVATDLLTGDELDNSESLALKPYQALWLQA